MLVGIDTVDSSRLEKLLEKENFLNKYFTEYEKSYINSTIANRRGRMAGIYCAKEAFLKAVGSGIGGGINLIDVEVRHRANGKPYLVPHNNAKKVLYDLGVINLDISITHTANVSTAICICQ